MRYLQSLLLILIILVSSGTSVASTAKMEPVRFQKISYGSTDMGQLDIQTLRYEKDCYRDELLISGWIKSVPDNDSGEYTMSNYLFRIKEREIMLLDMLRYDSEGHLIYKATGNYNMKLWEKVIPDTVAERWYMVVMKYVQDNNERLKEEYKERGKI